MQGECKAYAGQAARADQTVGGGMCFAQQRATLASALVRGVAGMKRVRHSAVDFAVSASDAGRTGSRLRLAELAISLHATVAGHYLPQPQRLIESSRQPPPRLGRSEDRKAAN